MVSAYPGLFYPGQVYPGQLDTAPPPPPVNPGDTSWGSWLLASDGTWIRRATRVLVWNANPGIAPLLLTETGTALTTESGDRLTT